MNTYGLFDLISNREWDEAIEWVEDNPASAWVSLDSFIAMGSDQGNLALHEACKNQPPVEVIKALLEANPDAASVKGQWGYVPLHYACCSGASKDVVAKLIDAYPHGARVRETNEDVLPLHLACKWGADEDVVLEVLTSYPEASYQGDARGKTPTDYAKALSSTSTRRGVTKALGFAPNLCAASKASQDNIAHESERKLQDMAKVKEAQLEEQFMGDLNETRAAVQRLTTQLNSEREKAQTLDQELTKTTQELDQTKMLKLKYEKELTEEKTVTKSLTTELGVEKRRAETLDKKLKKSDTELKEALDDKEQNDALAASVIDQYGNDLKEARAIVEKQTADLNANKIKIDTLEEDLQMNEEYITHILKKKDDDSKETNFIVEKLEASFAAADKERKELQAILEAERHEAKSAKVKQRLEMQDAIDVAQHKLKTLDGFPAMFDKAERERKELSGELASEREKSRSTIDRLTVELSTEKLKNKGLDVDVKEKDEYIAQLLMKKEEDDEQASKIIKKLEAWFEAADRERKELHVILEAERNEASSTLEKQRQEMQTTIDAAHTKIKYLARFPSKFESAEEERKKLYAALTFEREEAQTQKFAAKTALESLDNDLRAGQVEIERLKDLVGTLEATKEQLDEELAAEKASVEELITSADVHKREFNKVTADFNEIIRAKDAAIDELTSRLEVFQKAQVALAVKAVKFEQMRQEASEELSTTVAELNTAKRQAGEMEQKLKSTTQMNEAYERRMQKVGKWISSLTSSMESWNVNSEWQQQYSETEDELNVMASFVKPPVEVEEGPASPPTKVIVNNKGYETDTTEATSVKSTDDEKSASSAEHIRPVNEVETQNDAEMHEV